MNTRWYSSPIHRMRLCVYIRSICVNPWALSPKGTDAHGLNGLAPRLCVYIRSICVNPCALSPKGTDAHGLNGLAPRLSVYIRSICVNPCALSLIILLAHR